MMGDKITPGRIILSVNRAILREVTENMRSVSALRDEAELTVRFVFYSSPSEGELEAMGYIGTEVVADFPEIERELESYDVIPTGRIERKANEYVVFERKQDGLSQ